MNRQTRILGLKRLRPAVTQFYSRLFKYLILTVEEAELFKDTQKFVEQLIDKTETLIGVDSGGTKTSTED